MFKGKAIYNPSGRAQEYSYWGCNFYVGCSNDCDYCYCKTGPLRSIWTKTPVLKKTLKDPETAMTIFESEVLRNLVALKKNGLFFSFTTDPMLDQTYQLTLKAIGFCERHDIVVKILTKSDRNLSGLLEFSNVLIGFTLTGCDEMEGNSSSNADRISMMKFFKDNGFRTFASIEPVICTEKSLKMIHESWEFCDLYKIGLLSGEKYEVGEIDHFVESLKKMPNISKLPKIYLKDSITKYYTKNLPEHFIGRSKLG